jgi:hypothetical protein
MGGDLSDGPNGPCSSRGSAAVGGRRRRDLLRRWGMDAAWSRNTRSLHDASRKEPSCKASPDRPPTEHPRCPELFPADWPATDRPPPDAGLHSPAPTSGSTTQLAQLCRVTGVLAGLCALAHVGSSHLFEQGHRVHTEGGELFCRHTVVAVASHPHDVDAELLGIGPGHFDILSAGPSRVGVTASSRAAVDTVHAAVGRRWAGCAVGLEPRAAGTHTHDTSRRWFRRRRPLRSRSSGRAGQLSRVNGSPSSTMVRVSKK